MTMMRKIDGFFRSTILTVSLGALLLAPQPARSEIDLYTGLEVGAWKASFEQEGFGQSVSIGTDVSPVFQATLGLRSGILFVEYTPFYFFNGIASSEEEATREEPSDASYYSLLNGNVGLRLPVAGLGAYVGGGEAHFNFSSGSDADYSGLMAKVGSSIKLGSFVQLRAEFQRLFATSDNSGDLPDGVSSRTTIYWLGLGFGI